MSDEPERRAPTPRRAVLDAMLGANVPPVQHGPRRLPTVRHPRRFAVWPQVLAGVWPDEPGGDWIDDPGPWANLVLTAAEVEFALDVWLRTRRTASTRIDVEERGLDGRWRVVRTLGGPP